MASPARLASIEAPEATNVSLSRRPVTPPGAASENDKGAWGRPPEATKRSGQASEARVPPPASPPPPPPAGSAGRPDADAGRAGGARGGAPAHLVYHREVTLDVPADQVEEAVHAIVHMQPLPVSPAASPRGAAGSGAASPAAAASSPHAWRVLEEEVWQQGQAEGGLPGLARSSGGSSGGRQSPFESAGSGAGSWDSSSSTSAHEVAVQPPQQPSSPPGRRQAEHPELTVPPPPHPLPLPQAAQQGTQRGSTPPSPAPPEQGGTGSPSGRQARGPQSAPTSPATPALAIPQARWQLQGRQPPGHTPLQQTSAEDRGWQGAPAAPPRRSRLAVSITAPLAEGEVPAQALPATALPAPQLTATGWPADGRTGGMPHSSSADEPQLTEIRGPWPPPPSPPQPVTSPPGLPRRSPLGVSTGGGSGPTGNGGPSGSPQLLSAFQQPRSGGPSWRQLDDGSWYSPGGEVDWEAGDEASSAAAALSGAAAAALISSPLVGAASYSPPLSPISNQLLQPGPPQRQLSGGGGQLQRGPSAGLQRLPSPPLQRGPQRAESLSHALPDFQRQPSPLSPTWSSLRAPSASAPTSPGGRGGGGGQPTLLGRRSGGLSASLQGEPSLRANLLPVLNASPDVSPNGGLPAPASPFRAPAPEITCASPDMGAGAAAGDAGAGTSRGSGGGFRDVGGLPTELIEKRERMRRHAESPREAYSGAAASEQASELRLPLLAASEGEAGSEQWAGSPGGARGGAGVGTWGATALLASSLLGAGLVAVPRVFALLGLVAGCSSLAAVLLLSYLSASFLIGASSVTGGRLWLGYAGVVRAALGAAGAALADAALAVHCFGMMVAGLMVMGGILVGSDGLLDQGDRATALAVVCGVVLAPLVCVRRIAALASTSAMAVAASSLAAAAVIALTAAAARHGDTHRLHAWPNWRALGAHRSGAWASAVQLAAVVPVLLAAPPCQLALQSAMLSGRPHASARPAGGMRAAASLSLLYASASAAVLAICCCALFGRGLQANVLLEFTPDALALLVGDIAGRAAYLTVRLAYLVALSCAIPLLMAPFRDALWSLLFWQPLLPGAGFLLVTLGALASALWASLQVVSLWALLSLLGFTTGCLLMLLLPGLAAVFSPASGVAQRGGGVLLAVAGAACCTAGVLRLALYPAPHD
ncbi:hypothetical protein ABPG75_004348 [Micractinium tetrahymenae]